MHFRAVSVALLVGLASWPSFAPSEAHAGDGATILAGAQTLEMDAAVVEGEDLWIPLDQITAVTGFELKPQGLCAGDTCLLLPADGSWIREQDGTRQFCVTRFAKNVDQAFAVDAEHNVW